jgi:hypothetical protein
MQNHFLKSDIKISYPIDIKQYILNFYILVVLNSWAESKNYYRTNIKICRAANLKYCSFL